MPDDRRGGSDPCRALWLSVLLQAKEDLRDEPIDSIDYNAAVAFFTGGGEWTIARRDIADLLEIDPDALRRLGHRWVGERRLAEGLAPEPVRAATPAVPRAEPRPVPKLIASSPPAPTRPPEALPRRVSRGGHRSWEKNPFHPLMRQLRG